MLSKLDVEKIARDYLQRNEHPIVDRGNVIFPEDRYAPEEIEHFKKKNIASVFFQSKHLDDPNYEIDPGVYMVYVNIITGEVHMPSQM